MIKHPDDLWRGSKDSTGPDRELSLFLVHSKVHSVRAELAVSSSAPSENCKSPSVHVSVLLLSIPDSRSGHYNVPAVSALVLLPESALALLSGDGGNESRVSVSLEVLRLAGPEAVVGLVNESESSLDLWMGLFLPHLFCVSVVLNKGKLGSLASGVSSRSLHFFSWVSNIQVGRKGGSDVSLGGVDHDGSSIVVSNQLDLAPSVLFSNPIHVMISGVGLVGGAS